jgi:hypothetical protein
MGEPILRIAGIRALYLQALDPGTMRGTWQNSALAHRHAARARFLRTTEFVRTRTYGTTPDVERAGRRVTMPSSSTQPRAAPRQRTERGGGRQATPGGVQRTVVARHMQGYYPVSGTLALEGFWPGKDVAAESGVVGQVEPAGGHGGA